MKEILRFFVLAGLGATLFAASNGGAQAATRYDGTWTVYFTTVRGDCASGSSFRLQVHDGIVSGAFNAHGHVSANGSTQVSVSNGSGTATGSGRLTASSGGGTWHATGSSGACTGRWSANR